MSSIFRNLVITSPHHIRGEDVGDLQAAIDRQIKRLGLGPLGVHAIGVDKDFGFTTLQRARDVGRELGAPDAQLGGPVRPWLQRLIRAPWVIYASSPTTAARALRRRSQRKRRRKTGVGAVVALRWCQSQVNADVREHPPGSNTGPEVSGYQRNFGIDGAPWCGAFVGTAMIHGGLHPSSRITYVPYIAQDYPQVSWTKRQAGDLVCFNFGAGLQHVGMLAEDRTGTYEGNTSPGEQGSQDNGGVVAYKHRDRASMAVIVRPPW